MEIEQRNWQKLQRIRLERVHRWLARPLGRLVQACGVDSEVALIKSRDPSLNGAMTHHYPAGSNRVDIPFPNMAFLHLGDHRNTSSSGGPVPDSIHRDSTLGVVPEASFHREGIHRVSSSVVLLLRGTCHDLDLLHPIHMLEVGQIRIMLGSSSRVVLRQCRVNGGSSRDQVAATGHHPRSSSSSKGGSSSRGDRVVGLPCSSIWDSSSNHSRDRGRDFLQMGILDSIHLVGKGHHHSSSSNDQGRRARQIILAGINKVVGG